MGNNDKIIKQNLIYNKKYLFYYSYYKKFNCCYFFKFIRQELSYYSNVVLFGVCVELEVVKIPSHKWWLSLDVNFLVFIHLGRWKFLWQKLHAIFVRCVVNSEPQSGYLYRNLQCSLMCVCNGFRHDIFLMTNETFEGPITIYVL